MIHLLTWYLILAAPGGSADSFCRVHGESRYPSIRHAEFFSNSAVGYGGSTPMQVRELRCILSRPDASDVLDGLIKHATLAGQLFILAGIYLIDTDRFERVARPHARDKRTVKTVYGCIESEAKVASVLDEMRKGDLPRELGGP